MNVRRLKFLFTLITLLLLVGNSGYYNAQQEKKSQGNYNSFNQSEVKQKSEESQNNKIDNSLKLIEQIEPETLPYAITEEILNSIDTEKAYSQEQFNILSLSQLNPTGNQYEYIPIANFKLSNNFYSILILQYYTEESFAWLINYSLQGEYIDALKVFYDNSEGFMWTNSIIKENEIVVETGNIYENNEKPIINSIKVDNEGHFKRRARNFILL